MTRVDQERLALEMRAEALAFVSADAAVRRGESDRFEIGRLASSDAVDGQEAQHIGGAHAESAHAHTVRAMRLETRVDGGMSLRGHSDTTLLGGAMTETCAGPVLLMAGMSDSLVAGGGLRVSVADLAVAGLVGVEEKIGTAIADGALIEAYATHFEREYGPGNHTAGFASFTGTVHVTSASGFRPLFKVASGVRNLTAGGGGGGGGPEGAAVHPARRPLPPLPPDAAGHREVGLIGETPEFAGIYSEVGDVDIYGDIHEIVGNIEEPIFADVHRSVQGIANETTGAGETFIGESAEAIAVGGTEASRGADTADVLGDLRATAELQGTDDALDADKLGRLEELFNTADEAAGATDEVSSRIEDASGTLADLDQRGAASATGTDSAHARDPRDLTLPQLEAHRSDGQDSWVEALSPKANAPPKPSTEDYMPAWIEQLETWDDEIVGLLNAQQRPALPPGDEGARTQLLEDLRSAEATARGDFEKRTAAGQHIGKDVTLDRLNTYRFAADAVQQGEDPLPALNDLLEISRWRSDHGTETYIGQYGGQTVYSNTEVSLNEGDFRAGGGSGFG